MLRAVRARPAPTRTSLSAAEARRLALASQGLAGPRPEGRADGWGLRRVIGAVGLLQIDSVNVLARDPSHAAPGLVMGARHAPAQQRLQLDRHQARLVAPVLE